MKKIPFILIFGFLLFANGCDQDNLDPASNEQTFPSVTAFFSSGSDMKTVPTKPYTGYNLINTRSVAVTFYTDPADFNCPGLPVEDFEEGVGDLVGLPHPLDEFSSNSVFSPGDILSGVSFSASNDHTDDELALISPMWGASSKAVLANYFDDYFIIHFTDEGVFSVSMDIIDFFTGGTPLVVEVYGINGSLGSTSVPSTLAGAYLGITSTEAINLITVLSPSYGAEGVDNLAFGSCGISADQDGDGISDGVDNCPSVANAGQENCDGDSEGDMCDADDDNDGVNDVDDSVDCSDTGMWVNIDSCNSGVANHVFSNGNTMMDLINQCAVNSENHGEFVSCVSHLTNKWKKDGVISEDEKEAIMDCAATAGIPE